MRCDAHDFYSHVREFFFGMFSFMPCLQSEASIHLKKKKRPFIFEGEDFYSHAREFFFDVCSMKQVFFIHFY